MKKYLVLVLFVALLSCTNEQGAREVLEIDGFTNIEITGYKFFSCSKDDFYHTGFIAEKNGRTVEGTVCEGLLFKGKTIRFE
jgi:hypothetical protein